MLKLSMLRRFCGKRRCEPASFSDYPGSHSSQRREQGDSAEEHQTDCGQALDSLDARSSGQEQAYDALCRVHREDDEIAQVAARHGAFVLRCPAELATDDADTLVVLQMDARSSMDARCTAGGIGNG